jgi:hypothetical protein
VPPIEKGFNTKLQRPRKYFGQRYQCPKKKPNADSHDLKDLQDKTFSFSSSYLENPENLRPIICDVFTSVGSTSVRQRMRCSLSPSASHFSCVLFYWSRILTDLPAPF